MINKSMPGDNSRIAVVVMTNGRKALLQRTIASFDAMCFGNVTWRVIHDDSGDPEYYLWLVENYPKYDIVKNIGEHGFGKAMRNARTYVRRYVEEGYIFWLEDDFTFNRKVNLNAMVDVLGEHPLVYQLVLKRQPWNSDELSVGDIVMLDPNAYRERTDGTNVWTEHTKFYTTNPSLSRLSSISADEWPEGERSEGVFSFLLRNKYPHSKFAFWGGKHDEPAVTHIGLERTGSEY